jgi:hypothetical protein
MNIFPQKNSLGEEGQSIFEFVIFLPFLIYLFSMMINVTNSINASINQQKAVRGYMFHYVKGNAMAPTMTDLKETYEAGGIDIGAATSIGWREKSASANESLAPCFKFVRFLGSPTDETCEDASLADEPNTSTYVRVFTFFGLCGATYRKSDEFYQPDDIANDLGSCTLQ